MSLSNFWSPSMTGSRLGMFLLDLTLCLGEVSFGGLASCDDWSSVVFLVSDAPLKRSCESGVSSMVAYLISSLGGLSLGSRLKSSESEMRNGA